MKQNNTSKFSTWTLWSPLKFATMAFCLIISITAIYSLIAGAIYTPATTPQTPLTILFLIGFIAATTFQIKSLPRDKMDRTSFMCIHNTQTILLSSLFIISSYLIARNAQRIIFYLLTFQNQSSGTLVIIFIATLLFYLYLLGLLFANIYAKFCRIRDLNIPTWKIICSMPFGFAALWTPGYIIKTSSQKKPTFTPKSKWLNGITNWMTSHSTNTIATFIAITLISGFVMGFNSVLLTFSLALIFGIWALQSGTKTFIKNISGKYATMAIVINLILIIITGVFYVFVPDTDQNVHITITETEITETQPQ